MTVPVIDLFAGPGGLGEGFSSVTDDNGNRFFDIKLSIEMDPFAHKTLELRGFLRQFPINKFPSEYYEMVRENNPKVREELKTEMFSKFKDKYAIAKEEAWQCELGGNDFPPELVDSKIENALDGNNEWVLIGGPPCQAYSVVGRARNRGISEDDQRVYLYREYLRIIARHKPKVFVMENVKGLLSAKLDGNKIFDWIKKDLKNPGRVFPGLDSPDYRLYSFVKEPDGIDENGDPLYKNDRDYLIRTEEFGIPQKRHRVILLGVRDDVEYTPEILKKRPAITLKSVIDDLPKIRSVAGRKIKSERIEDGRFRRKYSKIEDTSEQWNQFLEQFRNEFFEQLNSNNSLEPDNDNFPESPGKHFIKKSNTLKKDHPLYKWITDNDLKGVLNHESRSHLYEDLKRYYFYSLYSRIYSSFPRLKDVAKYDERLLPKHQNVLSGNFEDRFRVQMPGEPATTVTSHISKDGHYFIHYDYNQCRSLTVREAARIQTFPDNYLFWGPRTQQYHQVGNAVPPFLAYKLGYIVKNIYKNIQ